MHIIKNSFANTGGLWLAIVVLSMGLQGCSPEPLIAPPSTSSAPTKTAIPIATTKNIATQSNIRPAARSPIAPTPRPVAVSIPAAPTAHKSTLPTPRKNHHAAKPAPSIQLANHLLKQGKRAEAADMYFTLGTGMPTPQRERVIVQAAEIAASIGDSNKTNHYLKHITRQQMTGETQVRYRYVKALLAIQTKQPQLVAQLLPPALNQGMPAALVQKMNRIRQAAQRHTNTQSTAQPQAPQNQAPALPAQLERVAVLLPQSGRLASVSNELYTGIKIAHAQVGSNIQVKLYDSSQNAAAQYQQAIAEGADLVIGPLDKGNLAQLIAQPQTLSKPILALNYLNNQNTPGTLFQFGLAPEDEARQVAQFALARRQTQATVLVPNSSWGQRLENAFAQTYSQHGGNILHIERYSKEPTRYMQHVQNALQAGQGSQMVFLAASPSQARLIRPLLKAKSEPLPVYATSHIFSGKPDSNKDRDLDGIIYTEIPWVLESIAANNNSSQFPRLRAMGIDAFLIAKNIANLAQGAQALRGKTGQVRMMPDRRIQRMLEMATFTNGIPTRLGH